MLKTESEKTEPEVATATVDGVRRSRGQKCEGQVRGFISAFQPFNISAFLSAQPQGKR
jgi:hypothetical protein